MGFHIRSIGQSVDQPLGKVCKIFQLYIQQLPAKGYCALRSWPSLYERAEIDIHKGVMVDSSATTWNCGSSICNASVRDLNILGVIPTFAFVMNGCSVLMLSM